MGAAQVVRVLKIEPELRRGPQRMGELHGHRGGDTAFFGADLVDHADLDADMTRQAGLREAMLREELAKEHSGMKGGFDHGLM